MWRTGTRLPFWTSAVLAGGLTGGLTGGLAGGTATATDPRERRDEGAEEAVLVTFAVPDPGSAPELAALQEAVDRALWEARTGELEAVQPGPGRVTVLAYGTDAERLWESIQPVVRAFPYRPAEATLRFGPIGAPEATVAL